MLLYLPQHLLDVTGHVTLLEIFKRKVKGYFKEK